MSLDRRARRARAADPETPTRSLGVPRSSDTAGILALFAAVVWIVHGRARYGPFVFDDIEIQGSPWLHAARISDIGRLFTSPGIPRRITRASLAFNYYLGGLDPYGYHLVSLALHALNGTLLFVFAFQLLGLLPDGHPWRRERRPIAFAGALLWLVHPVNTQAVAYAWQRSTLLCAWFFLGALVAYLAGRSSTGPRRYALWGLALVGGVMAIGSKENAATLPLFVVLIELLFPRAAAGPRRRALALGAVAAFVGMAAVYLGPRFVEMLRAQYAERGFTLQERLLTESRVVGYYVTLLTWPHPSRLRLDYDFPLSRSLFSPPATALCLVALAGTLAAAVIGFRRWPLLSLAILWFLGNLAIESTVVPLDLAYEHRLYLPAMMPVVGLAGLLCTRVLATRRSRLWLAPLVVLLSVWSAERCRVWADPVLLFEDNARKAPGKVRVHNFLGRAYLERNRPLEAKAAFERALALDADFVPAYNGLAFVELEHFGNAAEARRLLEVALRKDPKAAVPLNMNLGMLCVRLGDFDAAAEHFRAAVRLGEADRVTAALEAAASHRPDEPRLRQLLESVQRERGSSR
jgi:tetratricopeptide (TPR) repeat protein